MKAIKTEYFGPTHARGSRIIASDADKNRIITSLRLDLTTKQAHEYAAVALCQKMGWKGELIGGSWKPGIMFWVFK